MSEELTKDYNFLIGDASTGDPIGIVREISISYGGDKEEIAGLDNVADGILRKKHIPVDSETTVTVSGIVDRDKAGYTSFHTAMKNRAEETLTVKRPDGSAVEFTGYRDTYDPETITRGEATVKFSLTFDSNTENVVAAPA